MLMSSGVVVVQSSSAAARVKPAGPQRSIVINSTHCIQSSHQLNASIRSRRLITCAAAKKNNDNNDRVSASKVQGGLTKTVRSNCEMSHLIVNRVPLSIVKSHRTPHSHEYGVTVSSVSCTQRCDQCQGTGLLKCYGCHEGEGWRVDGSTQKCDKAGFVPIKSGLFGMGKQIGEERCKVCAANPAKKAGLVRCVRCMGNKFLYYRSADWR